MQKLFKNKERKNTNVTVAAFRIVAFIREREDYICHELKLISYTLHWHVERENVNRLGMMAHLVSGLYIQEWHTKVASSSKGKTYNLFKHDIHFKNYLTKLIKKHYSTLLKFRLSNHRFPIETCRWENIPLEERKCNLCEKSDIGDEFHYLFVCNHFKSERKHFLRPYFYKSPNIIKFKKLLSTKNINLLIKLSSFVGIIMKKFSSTNN